MTALRESGYASAAFLGNPVLSSASGLLENFDSVFAARWWEPYLPLDQDSEGRSPKPLDSDTSANSLSRAVRLGLEMTIQASLRFSSMWNRSVRILNKLIGGSEPRNPRTASWLEKTLDHWLREQSSGKPVFVLVNLNDAHEPYLERTPTKDSNGGASPNTLTRQDRLGWLTGSWDPTPVERANLRLAYYRQLELLDARLRVIVETFRKSQAAREPILVVTSDHGQCFGEHEMMFHSQGTHEELLRVPLILSSPGLAPPGTEARGWASLVDVMPTILNRVDPEIRVPFDGVLLESLVDRERTTPAYAVSTGIDPRRVAHVAPHRRAMLDGIRTASYLGHWKLVTGPNGGEPRLYDLGPDSSTDEVLQEKESARLKLARSGRALQSLIGDTGALLDVSAEVSSRLSLWGY